MFGSYLPKLNTHTPYDPARSLPDRHSTVMSAKSIKDWFKNVDSFIPNSQKLKMA